MTSPVPSLRYDPSASDRGCVAFEVVAPTTVRAGLLDLGLSRAAVGRLDARGQLVRGVGTTHLPVLTPLVPGDSFSVLLATDGAMAESALLQTPAIDILYEDLFVLAVDKPAGLLVHGDGTGAPTLTDRVHAYLQQAGAPQKAQAIQRLDTETTGVVLFSKTAEFQPLFDALVAGDGMRKRYLAIVAGAYPYAAQVYCDPIARDRHDARRMRVGERGGQPAHTHVERLAVAPDGSCSLLGVELGTGRRHQIRAHLSAHGYPLVGDGLYGYRGPRGEGLMLHAVEESFVHPLTREPVRVSAGWPQRFSCWFDASVLDRPSR